MLCMHPLLSGEIVGEGEGQCQKLIAGGSYKGIVKTNENRVEFRVYSHKFNKITIIQRDGEQ